MTSTLNGLKGIEIDESVLREYIANYLLEQKLYAQPLLPRFPYAGSVFGTPISMVSTQDEAIAVLETVWQAEKIGIGLQEVTWTKAARKTVVIWVGLPRPDDRSFETEAFNLDNW
jgi:hypothetical protein